MGLIDFHAHLSPTETACERLLDSMARSQIHRSAVVAGGIVSPQTLSCQMAQGKGQNLPAPNREVLKLCSRTEKKLLPFYFANPYDSTEEYNEIGRHFYGLKLGPALHGIALTDVRNLRYIEKASDFDHPVYLHCLSHAGFEIECLQLLAHSYPYTRFVLGHAGIGNCDFFAVDRICEFSNIYFETSGGFSSVIRYAAEKLGLQRMLFGSEYPLQDPALEILKMKLVDIPSQALNENASQLLGLGEFCE